MKKPLSFLDRISGLVLDERTGKVVAVKLFATSGGFSAFVWFNYHNWKTGFNAEQWGIFLVVCGLWKVTEKAVGMKYGPRQPTPPAPPDGGAQ